MSVTVNKLIEIESKLLLIEKSTQKFNLTLQELLILKEYLKEIGNITSIFFESQIEYAKLVYKNENAEEMLKIYHDKLENSELELDVEKYENFINKVNK